jgi:hypothetical protein
MKRPAEYYTLWNQAVEAVEIYLARNPRELSQDDLEITFNMTFAFMRDAAKYQGREIIPYGYWEQSLVAECLPKIV